MFHTGSDIRAHAICQSLRIIESLILILRLIDVNLRINSNTSKQSIALVLLQPPLTKHHLGLFAVSGLDGIADPPAVVAAGLLTRDPDVVPASGAVGGANAAANRVEIGPALGVNNGAVLLAAGVGVVLDAPLIGLFEGEGLVSELPGVAGAPAVGGGLGAVEPVVAEASGAGEAAEAAGHVVVVRLALGVVDEAPELAGGLGVLFASEPGLPQAERVAAVLDHLC
jgi:hypothetical protein